MKYWNLGSLLLGILLIGIAALHIQTPFDNFAKDSFDGIAQTIGIAIILGAGIILLYLCTIIYMVLSSFLPFPKIPKEIEQKIIGNESNRAIDGAIERLVNAVYYSCVAFASIMAGAIGGAFVGYADINYMLVFGIFLMLDGTCQLLRKDSDKVPDKPKKKAKKA